MLVAFVLFFAIFLWSFRTWWVVFLKPFIVKATFIAMTYICPPSWKTFCLSSIPALVLVLTSSFYPTFVKQLKKWFARLATTQWRRRRIHKRVSIFHKNLGAPWLTSSSKQLYNSLRCFPSGWVAVSLTVAFSFRHKCVNALDRKK